MFGSERGRVRRAGVAREFREGGELTKAGSRRVEIEGGKFRPWICNGEASEEGKIKQTK